MQGNEENGTPHRIPAIMVGFDADKQQVVLQFDPDCFRDWNYVIGLLEMAKLRAQDLKRDAMMLQIADQHQARELQRKLLKH